MNGSSNRKARLPASHALPHGHCAQTHRISPPSSSLAAVLCSQGNLHIDRFADTNLWHPWLRKRPPAPYINNMCNPSLPDLSVASSQGRLYQATVIDLADKYLYWLLWYEAELAATVKIASRCSKCFWSCALQITFQVASALCITMLCRAGSWSLECG